MADTLKDFAGRLRGSAAAVRDASGEISSGSQDLASRTESQAASIEETAASMHEITTTVKQNADNAAAANQLATVARDTAEKGGSVVADAVAAVSRKIGRASCRERVCQYVSISVVAVALKKKKTDITN